MFSRRPLIGALSAIAALAMPAFAQIDSESMDDLTAWGTRYLDADDAEFPSSLWSNSDNQTLLVLMESLSAERMTPAERAMLRRLVLSPARKPSDEKAEELLTQRVRLMLEVGEAEAAAQLAPRLQQTPDGLNAETFAIDLELARGEEATACGRLTSNPPEGLYGLKLRAVCAVLNENFAGAELAVEVASAQGLDDPWFVAAVFAASGDSPNPPQARFDAGMHIALSLKADLDTADVDLTLSRADLAAALAQRESVPLDLRAGFAAIARRADLVSAKTYRQVVADKLAANENVATSALEETVLVFDDPLTNDSVRADSLNNVLNTAASGDYADYRATATFFLPELKSLNKSANTKAHAVTFARAALAAGETELAGAWLNVADGDSEAFDIARLQVLRLVAGGDASIAAQHSAQDALLDAADNEDRIQDASRILATWTGFDFLLAAPARTLLLNQDRPDTAIAPNELLAIRAATRQGAIGEAALMILTQTQGAPETLVSADLAELIRVLREIGAEDIAESLALEAAVFWKADADSASG